MRIHEIVDTMPAGVEYAYICHAPDGVCKILAADGCVYDHPDRQLRHLAPAVGLLFDAHWRGANAHEIAAHPWPHELQTGEARAIPASAIPATSMRDSTQPPVGRAPGEQPARV